MNKVVGICTACKTIHECENVTSSLRKHVADVISKKCLICFNMCGF